MTKGIILSNDEGVRHCQRIDQRRSLIQLKIFRPLINSIHSLIYLLDLKTYKMNLNTVLFLAAASKASAFSTLPVGSASRTQLGAARVFYDTQTGNTETCAGYIAEAAGVEAESIGMYPLCIFVYHCCH